MSGKTEFVKKLINNVEDMFHPVPSEIVWCYGEWQSFYSDYPNIRFIEGLPNVEQWNATTPRLVIIDDLMNEADDRVSSLFTKGSHHKNISVIFIVQNIFNKNKNQRTVSLNSHYICLLKNPRDATQVHTLARQIYPRNSAYMLEAFKDATSRAYGYLLIDLRQETPTELRLRTSIFPTERHVVYVPKNGVV